MMDKLIKLLLLKLSEFVIILKKIPTWFWNDILFPFLLVRLVLVVSAWFAPYFLPNPTYQKFVNQGYFLSPNYWIDMWCRWDSKWYLSIVTQGYVIPQGFPNVLSNLAFFPLYPYLVKLTAGLLPAVLQKTSSYLLIGLVISNVSFLVTLTILYKLVKEYLFDNTVAQRTIVLLLVFPTSFYLTSFYTEGLYLCLAVCSFYAALKNKWAVAGLLSGLIAITRIQGLFMVVILAWIYMEKRKWSFRQIRPDVLWLATSIATFFSYSFYLYRLDNNPLAFLDAQKAWSRAILPSLSTAINTFTANYKQVDYIDLFMFIGFLVLSILVLFKFSSKSYGLFSLGSLAIPLASLQIFSITRFFSCFFPVFILLGYYSKNKYLYYSLALTWFVLMILFWVGWQNYYWIE